MVLDVAFAHSDEVILACVDEYGNLFVHSCQSASDGKIMYPFQLKLVFDMFALDSIIVFRGRDVGKGR